jgi:hypothetical protein
MWVFIRGLVVMQQHNMFCFYVVSGVVRHASPHQILHHPLSLQRSCTPNICYNMSGCKYLYWCFGEGTYCLLLQCCSTVKMEAAHSSETQNFFQTTWLHIASGSNLHNSMLLTVLINILQNTICTFFRLARPSSDLYNVKNLEKNHTKPYMFMFFFFLWAPGS